jgi:hypothetical protein
MPLTVRQYDLLESAILTRRRLAVVRRGREYLVVPERLTIVGGRERIDAQHPTTGDVLRLFVDELDSLSEVR